jgi:hypothetical protein
MDESMEKQERAIREFILKSGWPCWQGGEEIKVKTETWAVIIEEILYLLKAGDVLNSLSGFTPIKSFVNHETKDGAVRLMTDVGIVKFSEGLGFDTHCHEIDAIRVKKVNISDEQRFEERKMLLITRKNEWVIFHSEADRHWDKEGNVKIIFQKAEFAKTYDISEFLTGVNALKIIDILYLWLGKDIDEKGKMLEKEKDMRNHIYGIYQRGRKVLYKPQDV